MCKPQTVFGEISSIKSICIALEYSKCKVQFRNLIKWKPLIFLGGIEKVEIRLVLDFTSGSLKKIRKCSFHIGRVFSQLPPHFLPQLSLILKFLIEPLAFNCQKEFQSNVSKYCGSLVRACFLLKFMPVINDKTLILCPVICNVQNVAEMTGRQWK